MGKTAHAALSSLPGSGPFHALWPADEGPESDTLVDHVTELADLRNWRTGLHGGSRHVVEGRVVGEAQS